VTCEESKQYCTTCVKGNYPVSGGCSPCTNINQCVECDEGQTFCRKCLKGYYPNKSGLCEACSTIS